MKAIHANSHAANREGRGKLFGKRAAEVLRVLRSARGPLTDREAMLALGFVDPNKVRPRMTELIAAGEAVEVGAVRCPVTGKTVRKVRAVVREAQATFELGDVLTPAVAAELNRRAS